MSIIGSTRTRLRSVTNPSVLRGLSVSYSTGAVELIEPLIPPLSQSIPSTVAANNSQRTSTKNDHVAALGVVSSAGQRARLPSGVRMSTPSSLAKTLRGGHENPVSPRSVSLSTSVLPSRVGTPPLYCASGFEDKPMRNIAHRSSSRRLSYPSSIGISSSVSTELRTLAQCSIKSSSSSLFSIASILSAPSRELVARDEDAPSHSQKPASPSVASFLASTLTDADINVPIPESPIAHVRRSALSIPMQRRTTRSEHIFSVHLRAGLSPEMVTAYTKRGCRLAIIVDVWHLENDSHREWEIAFSPQDVNMSSIRAVLDPDGLLTITVWRRGNDSGDIPPPVFL